MRPSEFSLFNVSFLRLGEIKRSGNRDVDKFRKDIKFSVGVGDVMECISIET